MSQLPLPIYAHPHAGNPQVGVANPAVDVPDRPNPFERRDGRLSVHLYVEGLDSVVDLSACSELGLTSSQTFCGPTDSEAPASGTVDGSALGRKCLAISWMLPAFWAALNAISARYWASIGSSTQKLTTMKERKPDTSPGKYFIEARAYDIAGMAAHDFWVLRDEGNYVLGQLHGLATNHKNEILPIGRVGDKLKFYHFGARAILLGLKPEHDFNFIKPDQKSMVVFAGNADDVLARWDNAVKALPYLNSLELPYTPFGILGLTPINSNTAYTLLGKLMGIRGHIFRGYWQPGWRNVHEILTASQLETMGYPQDASDSDSA